MLSFTETCPSNIALIKYWGKYANQIPANASISYTLTESYTKTTFQAHEKESFDVKVYLSGKENSAFAEKIKKYFISIQEFVPFVLQYSYEIHTENTFPHSSGIASSASGFGAIATCLMRMESELNQSEFDVKKASFLARLGSGSACRSLYKGLVVWGKNEFIEGSSNEYAISYPYEVHSELLEFCDSILLVHEGEKKVSSTVGHNLMNNNPYAKVRFEQANALFEVMKSILQSGDIMEFGSLIESEALTLHAMMMASQPYFVLMQPNTLKTLDAIWNFRQETKLPLFFTLDAGANVHILYPKNIENKAKSFIESELLQLSEQRKVIHDYVAI